MMKYYIENEDNIIRYIEKYDEFWIPINDWWSSFIVIKYCPRSWDKLPDSKRSLWFEKLENKWLEPWRNKIPDEFQTSKRRKELWL